MSNTLPTEICESVLTATINGVPPNSYRVLFTAERVMVVTGLIQGDQFKHLKAYIKAYSTGWEESGEIALMCGAQYVAGHPVSLKSLKMRLIDAHHLKTAISKILSIFHKAFLFLPARQSRESRKAHESKDHSLLLA